MASNAIERRIDTIDALCKNVYSTNAEQVVAKILLEIKYLKELLPLYEIRPKAQ